MYVCAVQAQAIGVRTGSYWPGCSSTPGEGWSSYVLVHIPPFSGVSLNRSDRFGFPRKFSIPIAQPLVTRCGHSIEYRCSVVCVEEAEYEVYLFVGEAVNEVCGYIAWVEF